MPEYWLTPPDLYARLDAEFHFDFDPCPYPRPTGFNGLTVEWGNSNYVNPPFVTGRTGPGPTAFVKKAIEQAALGKTSVLTLPVRSYVNMLYEAGAEFRPLGRVRWLDTKTKQPTTQPSPIGCFILRG